MAFLEHVDRFMGTGQKNKAGQELRDFLNKYDPKKYDCPSNTTDIIVVRCKERLVRWGQPLKLLMVKRSNHPSIGFWALPGGFVRPDETTEAAAKRELKEETGAVPDTFLPMGVTLPSPGCLSERLYLFLAKGLHMESQQLDEDEFLNVERIPFNEMVHRVMDGEIEDSKTIAAVLKAKVLLNL